MQYRDGAGGMNQREGMEEPQLWLGMGWQKWMDVGQKPHRQILAHQSLSVLGVQVLEFEPISRTSSDT